MLLKRFISIKEKLPVFNQTVDVVICINSILVIRTRIVYCDGLFYDTLLNDQENKHYYHYNKVYTLEPNKDYVILWWYPSHIQFKKYVVDALLF
jgi:hypothetical protein